jgi:tRNA threonylcarbamoyladenosine biosynthesis protein TsaB
LRSGIAAARAFALATGKPVVAATSLAVMALRAEEMLAAPLGARRLMVAVDARRGALYVQSFGAGLADASEPLPLTPEEAVRSLGGASGLVIGSGAEAVAAAARDAGGPMVEPRFPDLQPDARSLAALAPRLAIVRPVRPLYLRLPDVRPQAGASLARTHA